MVVIVCHSTRDTSTGSHSMMDSMTVMVVVMVIVVASYGDKSGL